MWLASCFPDCLPPFSYFLCLFFCCAVVFLYPFLCRFSFCLSFRCMFLYCFLPVSFLPLAFILCPTPGCRVYRDPDVEHAETRVSNMSRPGCHAMPFRISVFSFSLPLFLFARMRIYYNVSLLPDFPSSLKNMFFNTFVNQRFIKMFKKNAKKSPYIFGVYVIKSYFCTRFREREQRCFDILTGTA